MYNEAKKNTSAGNLHISHDDKTGRTVLAIQFTVNRRQDWTDVLSVCVQIIFYLLLNLLSLTCTLFYALWPATLNAFYLRNVYWTRHIKVAVRVEERTLISRQEIDYRANDLSELSHARDFKYSTISLLFVLFKVKYSMCLTAPALSETSMS